MIRRTGRHFTTTEFNNLTANQAGALTEWQIAGMTTTQFSALARQRHPIAQPRSHCRHSTDAISALTTEQGNSFLQSKIDVMTFEQVAALTEVVMKNQLARDLPALSTT